MGLVHLVILILAAQLSYAQAAAPKGTNFTATLESIKIQGRPGLTVNRNFMLTLGADEKRLHFRSSTSDFWRSEDGRQSFYPEAGTLERSCAKWVTINPVEQAVDPGQVMTVRLSIAIPADVQPGGFWCVLNVNQLPDPLEQNEGVQIKFLASMSVGIFVYVDPVDRQARVTDVEISADDARVTMENQGNTPIGVQGRLEFLRAGEAKPVSVVIIGRQTIFTEPIRTAILMAKLPDPQSLPAGEYTVRAILDIGLDHFIGVQKKLDLKR